MSQLDLSGGNLRLVLLRLREWAPRAFAEFARTNPLHAIGTRGFPWIEIDFPDDYQRALREVLPDIEADGDAGDGSSYLPVAAAGDLR